MKDVRYTGGCHCGAVRFAVVPESDVALACNCSMCAKFAFLHVIVPRDRFTLLRGEEALTTYTFNTGVAKHTFCSKCGVKSFYTPRSHPTGFSVNLRCLDGDVMDQFTIEAFDGQNWESNVESIRRW